jgi:lysozyme family protein
VKVDGIMGTKSMAALEAMKQTQISLGFTDKDVDGIRGIKTTAAINASGIKKCLLRLWH